MRKLSSKNAARGRTFPAQWQLKLEQLQMGKDIKSEPYLVSGSGFKRINSVSLWMSL